MSKPLTYSSNTCFSTSPFECNNIPNNIEGIRSRFSNYYWSRFSPETPSINTDMMVPELSEWLRRVQIRIKKSVSSLETKQIENTRWLSTSVGVAAIDFFKNTADLFPVEPIVYASNEGELVAEFRGKTGAITAVISPSFVILFANIKGDPLYVQINREEKSFYDADSTSQCIKVGV